MLAHTFHERIGRFGLQRLLAEDAQGALYQGVEAESGQPVLVQVLPLAPGARRPGWWRAVRRGRSTDAKALEHPNIARLVEAGRSDDAVFAAAESIAGETLEQLLARSGRLPTLQGLALVLQLLSALQFAHGRGQVHGALHPGTLLVARTGQLKVLGFGLERGTVLTPPAFRPPEQADGRTAHVATDLYAAALVAHVVLTGGWPGPRKPATAALRAVFERALAPDPQARYADAAAFSAALQAAVGEPVWDRSPARGVEPPSAAAVLPAPAVPLAAAPRPAQPVRAAPRPRVPSRPRWRPLLAGASAAAFLALTAGLLLRDEPALDTQTVALDRAPGLAIQPAPVAVQLAAAPAPEAPAPAPAPQVSAAVMGAPGILPLAPALTPAPRAAERVEPGRPAQAQPPVASSPPPPQRRPRAPVRLAQASRPADLGCRQDAALTREFCKAMRCASPGFQRHPVCVRMSADQRALNTQRELLGGR